MNVEGIQHIASPVWGHKTQNWISFPSSLSENKCLCCTSCGDLCMAFLIAILRIKHLQRSGQYHNLANLLLTAQSCNSMSSIEKVTLAARTSAILVLKVCPCLLTNRRVLLIDSCTRKSLIAFVRIVYETFNFYQTVVMVNPVIQD